MEFGLFSHGGDRRLSAADTYQADLEEIIAADELGYHEVWIAEHVARTTTTADHAFDPEKEGNLLSAVNPFIGKAAGLTKNIRMGPGVRPLAWYHPLDVATDAAVLDQLSRGRYMLGIGTGSYSSDQMDQRGIGNEGGSLDVTKRGTGVTSERHERWKEAIDVILRAWTAREPFDYDGHYYRGKRAWVRPAPYQKPHPPVGVSAGFTPSTVEFAGNKGFLPIFSHYATAETIREQGNLYVKAARRTDRKVGRADIRAMRYVYIAASVDKAKEELEPSIHDALRTQQFALRRSYLRPGDPPETMTFEYLIDAGYIMLGDPDTVYRRLADYYERSGGFGVLMLLMGHAAGTDEGKLRTLKVLIEEIAPRLNELERTLGIVAR